MLSEEVFSLFCLFQYISLINLHLYIPVNISIFFTKHVKSVISLFNKYIIYGAPNLRLHFMTKTKRLKDESNIHLNLAN